MTKRLLLVHTGGTLGMAPQAGGGLGPAQPGELLASVPEAHQLAEIEVVSPFLIDSADAGPAQWLAIAQLIAQRMDEVDGFVVVHGTDTMAYTATACSYLLNHLPKPVIFTGAQRPWPRSAPTPAETSLAPWSWPPRPFLRWGSSLTTSSFEATEPPSSASTTSTPSDRPSFRPWGSWGWASSFAMT